MRCLPLLLLIACDEQDLRIVDDLAVHIWQPDDDREVPMSLVDGCEPSRHDDALEATWCVRVSPEPDSDDDFTGGGCDTNGGTATDMRCSYYNLIGASALTGTANEPVLSYCDSDSDGGHRAAGYNATEASHVNELVEPGECRGAPQDGGAGGFGDTHITSYIRWDEDGENRVYLSEQTAHGVPIGAPSRVPGSEEPVRTKVSADRLFIQFQDGMLQARDLSDLSIPHFLATDAMRFGASTWEDRGVVAICDENQSIRAVFLEGYAISASLLLQDACSWKANPVVAASPETVVIGWQGSGGLNLAFIGQDLQEYARHTLSGALAEVTWDGHHFWSLDSDGYLQQWTDQGVEVGHYTHPFVPHPAATTIGLRIFIQDDTLITALIGEVRVVVSGHQSVTNTLDLSAVPLP